MRVQVKVNAAAPNTLPESPPGAPLHPLPPTAGARSESSALAPPDSRLKCYGKVFFCRGEREGAPGCWGALKELGELGTGVETLVVPWSLVRRPNLELAITYLFCLEWHTCSVVRLIVHILFLHFGIVWFLVQTVKARSAEFASSLHQ